MIWPFSTLGDEEQVARYVLVSRWVKNDGSIRPDAFIPHPHKELSVTRHRGISESKLWKHGQSVAMKRNKTLYGRADVGVGAVREHSIDVVPRPLWTNWNHACLIGWPVEKSLQKTIAQEIVANAQYVDFDG